MEIKKPAAVRLIERYRSTEFGIKLNGSECLELLNYVRRLEDNSWHFIDKEKTYPEEGRSFIFAMNVDGSIVYDVEKLFGDNPEKFFDTVGNIIAWKYLNEIESA